ncbi:hypothetical protein [Mesorhizobium sp. M7A.F.Ca.US.006.01.1.1]|uniref:hypothetical protein n=1 Tax=Mesorhizobium sp. M7A.F.Ca.US.006.01.1.1 TaxID=2496707 RepID=UPI0013E32593|nr:hypothetical protein [Mesorhizobium sp. M7A.F.Ca.US.006.01.1.1]
MNRLRLLFPALAAGLSIVSFACFAQDKPAGIDPEHMKAAFPEAWEGYERSPPEYEASTPPIGQIGKSSARFRDVRGGTNFFEVELEITDLGIPGGKMYQDYGADYLKAQIENDTQKSVTVKGLPGLMTRTGEDHMMIDTFVAPRLHVGAFCLKAQPAGCLAAIERFDFDRLKALANE